MFCKQEGRKAERRGRRRPRRRRGRRPPAPPPSRRRHARLAPAAAAYSAPNGYPQRRRRNALSSSVCMPRPEWILWADDDSLVAATLGQRTTDRIKLNDQKWSVNQLQCLETMNPSGGQSWVRPARGPGHAPPQRRKSHARTCRRVAGP